MRQLFTKLMLTSIGCLAAYSYGQTIVSTEPQNKKAILEEFTGVNCQYCPDGHAIAEQILNNNPGNAFAINIQSAGYAMPLGSQPNVRTQWGAAIDGQAGIAGYRAATVTRDVFPGCSRINGRAAMGRNYWA